MSEQILTMPHKTVIARQRKAVSSLFRSGSQYQTIATLGAGRPIGKSTLIRLGAKRTRNNGRNIRFIVDVLCHPKHRTNNGRVHSDRRLRHGMIQFVPGP